MLMTALTWIIVALVCGAIEIFTVGFWFLYLAISALVVALAVSIGWFPQIEAQLLVFAFLTILLVIFTRPLVVKLIKTNETSSNVKALVGQKGISIDKIVPLHYGQVKLNGEIWTAVSSEEIETGTLVEVAAIEGVKLIVQKVQE
jgi:membrane protein implicated in regulation of membrane protease activity